MDNRQTEVTEIIMETEPETVTSKQVRRHVRKERIGGQGRWTDKEHKLFLEGLKMYDNDWGRVQRHLKTRSCNQIRSHA